MPDFRSQIHKLPKADVHNHFHLGGNISSLRKKYLSSNIVLPPHYKGLDGMIDFIYNDLGKIMRTESDVIFFMENAIESSIKDNVTYLEASVDINLIKFFEHSIEKFIAVVAEIKERYKTKIEFRPDIGINKDLPVEQAYADGIMCMNSGVFHGIDLYGKEKDKALDHFTELYQEARSKKIKTKVHIGEFSNHKTIENVIHLLNPDEIQHGIRAVESKNTMDLILDSNIRLNVCPQSNISLGAFKSITEYPIRQLYDHGIKITINTDDFLLFDATNTDQFVDLLDHKIFNFEEVQVILKNGFD